MYTFRRWGLLVIALLLSACNRDDGPPAVEDPLALKPFAADCSDFLSYTAAQLTSTLLANCFPYECKAAASSQSGAKQEYDVRGPDLVLDLGSLEDGVEASQLVQVDARGRVYALMDGRLYAFNAAQVDELDNTEIVAIDTFRASSAPRLLLDEGAQSLLVFGGDRDGRKDDGFNGGRRSVAKIYDVSGARPEFVRSIATEGQGQFVYRIGTRIGRLASVSRFIPTWLDDEELLAQRNAYRQALDDGNNAGAELIKADLLRDITARVEGAGAPAFLPQVEIASADGSREHYPAACADIARPSGDAGWNTLLVESFDSDGGNAVLSGFAADLYPMHLSPENLYLADLLQLGDMPIHRISLSRGGRATYRARGTVYGLVERGRLSEYQGALRIVSTGENVNEDWLNRVTVLDATSNGTMKELGQLDFAAGRSLGNAALTGSRGFVAMFEQANSLFGLDLSDPAQPVVTDELSVSGLANELVPFGTDRLLKIGLEGPDDPSRGRYAVQLFDVSNIRDIRPLDVERSKGFISGSYIADSADAPLPGTISVPLSSGYGFEVIRVAAEQLDALGHIDHSVFGSEEACAPEAEPSDMMCIREIRAVSSLSIRDGADRYLVTLSNAGLIVSDDLGRIVVSRRWPQPQ